MIELMNDMMPFVMNESKHVFFEETSSERRTRKFLADGIRKKEKRDETRREGREERGEV